MGEVGSTAAAGGSRFPRGWRPPLRARKGSPLGLLALIALTVLAPFAWVGLVRATTVGDGTLTYPSVPAWTAGGVAIIESLPGRGELRVGDCVTAVDGIPIVDLASGRRHLPPVATTPGSTLTYTVQRPPQEGARDNCAGPARPIQVTLTRYPVAAAVRAHPGAVPLLVLMLLVASFVLLHRPRDPAARRLFALCALLPLSVTSWPMGNQVIDLAQGPGRWPFVWPFVLGEVVNALLWAALLHFALAFPRPRTWLDRPAAVVGIYALPFALYAVAVAIALPRARDPLEHLGVLTGVSRASGPVMPIVVAAALIVGYRQAEDPFARARVRWVLYTALACAVLYLGLNQLPNLLMGHPLVALDWLPVIFLPFPLALAVAVLRYSLFDIDVIVRRSLVYLAVTLLGAGIYVLAALVLDSMVDSGSRLIPLAAAGVLTLMMQPVLTRARRRISRLIFGARDDPSEVLARLTERLEVTPSPDAMLSSIVETLATTLRLAQAEIEAYLPDGSVERVSWGRPMTAPVVLPLIQRGEEIGRLVLSAAAGREPFGAADRRLIDTLVAQLSVTVSNLVLQRQLQKSLERVVAAREEERRRLRRDVHDGVGPTLAASTMRLELARSLLERDQARAAGLVDDVVRSQHELLDEVRRLVHALRPPELDQFGLVVALRQHAQNLAGPHPFTVTVRAPERLDLPAAVEVAAYRIVLEALANVLRHAAARTVEVRLCQMDGALIVEVADDGIGLPPIYRPGVGLLSMRERAQEIGGSVSVIPGPQGGTTVLARLPCPFPPHRDG